MFKIGEFSKLTQVSIRMLRYYDENGLLRPAQIDHDSGYRLYAADQIPTLNKIVFLRDLGFTVAEITETLANWSNSFITEKLDTKQLDIEQTIQTEQSKLAKIELAKKDIQEEQIALHYNVTIKPIPSYQVLSLRRVIPDYYAEGYLWKEMSAFADKNNIAVSESTFSIYHDLDYREKDVDVEICAPVAQLWQDADGFTFRNTEAVPLMASSMVYGPFENIAGAFRSFAGWLQEHNKYEMAGGSRQITHRGPWNEDNPENYLVESQIPLQIK